MAFGWLGAVCGDVGAGALTAELSLADVQAEIALAGDRLMVVRRELSSDMLPLRERELLVAEAAALDERREELYALKRRLLADPLRQAMQRTATLGPRVQRALELAAEEADRMALELLEVTSSGGEADEGVVAGDPVTRGVPAAGVGQLTPAQPMVARSLLDAPRRDWRRMLGVR